MMRTGFWLGAACVAACLAAWPLAGAAQVAGPWQQAGQLQMRPDDIGLGALTLSDAGDRVAGTVWRRPDSYVGAVWSLADGQRMAEMQASPPLLAPMRFTGTRGGAQVYSFGRSDLLGWSLTGGQPVLRMALEPDMQLNDVLYDSFHATYLLSTQMAGVQVYGSDGTRIAQVETDPVRPHQRMWLTDSGRRLVVESGGFTLTSRFGDLPATCAPATCEAAYQQLGGGYGPYEALLAVNETHGRIATLPEIDPARAGQVDGVYRPVAQPTIRVWDDIDHWQRDDPPTAELVLSTPPVWGAFSPDGRLLAVVTGDGALSLWRIESGTPLMLRPPPPGDWYSEVRFVPGSKMLVINTGTGQARVLQIGNGAVLQQIPAPATEVVISADGRVMVTSGLVRGTATIWRR